MLKKNIGSLYSTGSDAEFVSLDRRRRDALLPGHADEIAEDTTALAQSVREQLAREVAEIEIATATLRDAEPRLESWTTAPAQSGRQPRPVWLIIGVLWLSTALVIAGAVVAIAALAR